MLITLNNNPKGYENLPSPAYSSLFSNLNINELGRCALVCKNWNFHQNKPEIWKRIARIYSLPHSYNDKRYDNIIKTMDVNIDKKIRHPPDMLKIIFSYLNLRDLGKIAKVSKSWKQIFDQDILWIRLAKSLNYNIAFQTNVKAQIKTSAKNLTTRYLDQILSVNLFYRTLYFSDYLHKSIYWTKHTLLFFMHAFFNLSIPTNINLYTKEYYLSYQRGEKFCFFYTENGINRFNIFDQENPIYQFKMDKTNLTGIQWINSQSYFHCCPWEKNIKLDEAFDDLTKDLACGEYYFKIGYPLNYVSEYSIYDYKTNNCIKRFR